MEFLKLCPFCKRSLASLWGKPRFDRCRSCGLIVRNPIPSDDELAAAYDAAWNTPDDHIHETGATDDQIAEQFVDNIDKLGLTDSTANSRILDFGAGKGAIAEALVKRGLNCYAIDPFSHQNLVSRGIAAFPSIHAIPKELLFDGIVSKDVFEHLLQPWDSLAQLHKILKPSGWILLSMPNPNSLNAKYSKGAWREAQNPVHVMFYNQKTIKAMLLKAGFCNITRQRFYMTYSTHVLISYMHYILQMLYIDGSLNVLAWRR